MMEQTEHFEWSDGWLLMAILLSSNGTLASIIHIGDALNHAIFTRQELNKGFSRLERAGLICCSSSSYTATEPAQELLRKVRSKRLGMFNEVEEMARLLQRFAVEPVMLEQKSLQCGEVSEEGFEEATQTYHRRTLDLSTHP